MFELFNRILDLNRKLFLIAEHKDDDGYVKTKLNEAFFEKLQQNSKIQGCGNKETDASQANGPENYSDSRRGSDVSTIETSNFELGIVDGPNPKTLNLDPRSHSRSRRSSLVTLNETPIINVSLVDGNIDRNSTLDSQPNTRSRRSSIATLDKTSTVKTGNALGNISRSSSPDPRSYSNSRRSSVTSSSHNSNIKSVKMQNNLPRSVTPEPKFHSRSRRSSVATLHETSYNERNNSKTKGSRNQVEFHEIMRSAHDAYHTLLNEYERVRYS